MGIRWGIRFGFGFGLGLGSGSGLGFGLGLGLGLEELLLRATGIAMPHMHADDRRGRQRGAQPARIESGLDVAA